MTRINKFTYIVVAVFAAIIFIFSSLWSGGVSYVHAATSVEDAVSSYESRNIMDDLNGSVIAGEKFNLFDYPFDEEAIPQIISFVEFGYNVRSSNQDDYGLYVYVYNPQGLAIDTSRSNSKIQFACGENGNSAKYDLEFLNCSAMNGLEGLFYKFKVVLTNRQRLSVLSELSQHARIYSVSGFELSVKSVLTEYTVALTYTYSGFSKGYGINQNAESTLSCAVDGMEKYIELDVYQTVYRPKGDYYEGKQSQLNSCFFRVPEKYFTDFGDLTSISCEWYEYVTKPIFVTESAYLYQHLNALHGGDVHGFNSNHDFLVFSFSNTDEIWSVTGRPLHSSKGLGWASNIDNYDDYYHVWTGFLRDYDVGDEFLPESRFDNFAAVFYTGDNISYKNKYITSTELKDRLLYNSEYLGGPYLDGKYSEYLFTDYVNPDHTRGLNQKKINKDDFVELWWNEVSAKSFWQKIFGGYDVTTDYDYINAMYEVQAEDLKGSNAEIAFNLKISEKDVDKLKEEFNKCGKEERLVILRYGESEYYSVPSASSHVSSSSDSDEKLVNNVIYKWDKQNYDGYIAQETVYLGFDIISLWFTSEGAETEIPVISSPQDVISGLDPPLPEKSSNNGLLNLLKFILGLILLVVALYVLWKVISPFLLSRRNKTVVNVNLNEERNRHKRE